MKPTSSQDELLTRSLQTLAADISGHSHPPASNPIWLRAQRERRRLAVERAIRPLRIVETLAFLCSVLLAAFVLRQSVPTLLTPAALELGGLGLGIVLAGCCMLVHLARKSPVGV